MKSHLFHLIRLALGALIVFPTIVLAAPSASSPYYTDPVSSYVQDQVSNDMRQLNTLLCFLGGVAPQLMVNQGDYIALVDMNSCESSGSGSQNNNQGIEYYAVQANSTRSSNSSPMKSKIWLEFLEGSYTLYYPMYVTASQAPSKFYPYGIFRMDYCLTATFASTTVKCEDFVGFIEGSKTGLSYYTSSKNNDGTYDEVALQLSASSSSNSGSGIVVKSNNNSGVFETTATLFAYSDSYFYRDDGSSSTSGQCFTRSLKNADESAWRYGLYYADTGERFEHQSGFPIEYLHTDGVTYNGYISYYGLSMSVTPSNGATINKISYDTNPPTKTAYNLLKTAGKLVKYSTNFNKTLADLNKLPIWYYSRSAMTINTISGSTTPTVTVTPVNQYIEVYWDDSVGKKYFVVSGIYNPVTYNLEPLAVPGYLANLAIVTDAGGSGVNGWSQLVGGYFSIKGTAFAALDTTLSATPVISQSQDVVYPKDFAAITAAGGLKCTGDCPTNATISSYNPDFWATSFALNNHNYALDAASGNLLDEAGLAVANTTSTTKYTGRLITGDDVNYITTFQKTACVSVPCYGQSDVDLLSNRLDGSGNPVPYSYYVWQSSTDYRDQMAFLYTGSDTTNTVNFYSPLLVKYTVPNTTKYGTLAGSTATLEYDSFGSLWGIPNKCIDITNNTDCVFSGTPTPSANQRWTPNFSIPFSLTEGYVTADIDQLPLISKGTQLLVKALDKEVRLAKVNNNICIVLGLSEPARIPKLASYADWINPEATVGTKTVLNPVPAPRVIHGVKQY